MLIMPDPEPPTPAFLETRKRNPEKIKTCFLFSVLNSLKTLEKKAKTNKTKEIIARKQGNQKKQGLEGQEIC